MSVKTKESVQKEIAEVKQQLDHATDNVRALAYILEKLQSSPELYDYSNLNDALYIVEDLLSDRASEDCGDGYYGSEEYNQEFSVNDVKYIGTLVPFFNRHDKRFYYLDGQEFNYKEITQ